MPRSVGICSVLLFLCSWFPGQAAAVTFRVGLPLPQGGPSQWRSMGEAGRPLFLAVTDGLLGFDAATGFVKPGLAESWTNEGGLRWTFTLRSARWSDGSAVTAQDFADAWKLSEVKAVVKAVDARRFEAVFAEPVADVSVFTRPEFLLWPQAGRACGPFLLAASSATPLKLVKNKTFREAASIRLDALEFSFLAAEEAAVRYRDGGLDWVPWGGGPGTPGARRLHGVVAPGWGSVFLRLNLGAARLGDAAYRQALSDAVDRVSLARGLRGPVLLPSADLVPQNASVTDKAPGRLMGPLPEPKLTILYLQGETYRAVAQGVADDWRRKLGLEVGLRAAAYSQLERARKTGDYEVLLSSWLGDYPGPATFTGLFDDLSAVPAVPLLSYASTNQIDLRRWAGWTANPTDLHPWQGVGVRVRSSP